MRLPRHRGNLAIRNKNLWKTKNKRASQKKQRKYMMGKQRST